MESQGPAIFYDSGDTLLEDAIAAVGRTKSCLDLITTNVTPDNATFENTILPFVHDENERLWVQQFIEFHQYLDNKDVREAAEKASEIFQALSTEIGVRQDFHDLVASVKETDTMDDEDRRLLRKMISDYSKTGLNLSPHDQSRFREIQSKLADLSSKYAQNLSNSQCFIKKYEIDEHDLELKEVDGEYLIDQQIYSNVMGSTKSSDVRRKIYLAYNQKCKANATLLDQMVELRHELAQLRGYSTSAEYEMAHSEVGTSHQIEKLLGDLEDKIPRQYADIEKKFSQLKQEDGEEDTKIYPWDKSYYTRKLSKKEFDTEPLWFPVSETVSVLLGIFSQIFAMKFTLIDAPVWHKDVKAFEVEDNTGILGYLYMDLHSRPGRIANNSDQPVRPAFVDRNGKRRYTSTALMCSLGKDFMEHADVIMAFHELGHGIHDLVAKTKYARFHGASTGDFNETPSTMLENWCWYPAILRLFKGIRGSEKSDNDQNTKDGVLDEQQLQLRLEALIRARQTSRFLRQHSWLEYTLFDQALHQGCKDSAALWKQRGNQSYAFCNVPHWGWGACNCYCYLMCDVYSADMFETAFAKDPMNVEVGLRYKATVISKGNTVEPVDSVKEFLGREANSNAFYMQLGI